LVGEGGGGGAEDFLLFRVFKWLRLNLKMRLFWVMVVVVGGERFRFWRKRCAAETFFASSRF